MTTEGLCLRCGIANSRAQYACAMCGARLPWADPTHLRQKAPPSPRAEIREVRPNRWLQALVYGVLGFAGGALVLRGERLPTWHPPNNQPRSVQEDQIRVAAFKNLLPAPGSRSSLRPCFLAAGYSQGKDPSEFVMKQLSSYGASVKKISEAKVNLSAASDAVKDRATGEDGLILFVAIVKLSGDKAEVYSGDWNGLMMSCGATHAVGWDGTQWVVGEPLRPACS